MTTISAKIIKDSISPEKIRLTTIQLRYPRFVHAELMTHRVFSRNASSSRAVPVERLIEDIKRDTAMPIHWGKNQPGMQAREECNNLVNIFRPDRSPGGRGDYILHSCDKITTWEWARDQAIENALAFHKAGYHKQIVNRLLEPFSHINVLVTSTYWQNWFYLRDHPDAQPEICKLAQEMFKAMVDSEPKLREPGQWHLPYVTDEDMKELQGRGLEFDPQGVHYTRSPVTDIAIKLSVARCARVSYLTHDMKKPDIDADVNLYEKLAVAKPLHVSPAEHQATPDKPWFDNFSFGWKHIKQHGNFYGWRQYRKMLKGEFVNEYDVDVQTERLKDGYVW